MKKSYLKLLLVFFCLSAAMIASCEKPENGVDDPIEDSTPVNGGYMMVNDADSLVVYSVTKQTSFNGTIYFTFVFTDKSEMIVFGNCAPNSGEQTIIPYNQYEYGLDACACSFQRDEDAEYMNEGSINVVEQDNLYDITVNARNGNTTYRLSYHGRLFDRDHPSGEGVLTLDGYGDLEVNLSYVFYQGGVYHNVIGVKGFSTYLRVNTTTPLQEGTYTIAEYPGNGNCTVDMGMIDGDYVGYHASEGNVTVIRSGDNYYIDYSGICDPGHFSGHYNGRIMVQGWVPEGYAIEMK